MRSKTLNIVLLVVVALLDVCLLIFYFPTWVRLILGLLLLGLIIHLSSSLELAGRLGNRPLAAPARRRFTLLRDSTSDLLAEVRRLNWLVVDMERGFRNPDTAQADIEASEQALQEILKRIRKNAGKADPPFDEFEDLDRTPPEGPSETPESAE